MYLAFVVVASLLCSSHGKRIQGHSRESPLHSDVETHHEIADSLLEGSAPSSGSADDAIGRSDDKGKSLAMQLLALNPASLFAAGAAPTVQQQTLQQPVTMPNVDASRDSAEPPLQADSDSSDGAGWWAKSLGLRWVVLASIATAASRTGLLAPRMSADSDASATYFTEEDKEFFASRPIIPNRTASWIESGFGSFLLILGTVVSLILANTGRGPSYIQMWEKAVGFGPPAWHLMMPLREWINEALMAFFFFVVGMEIKKEFLFGSLASLRKAALPCVAALGGMVVPTAIYCMVQMVTGNPLTGWAIPMATDIAFAMGIYNLFKTRMPGGAAAFLLTLATVDDLGAIAVIAIAFAKSFSAVWFASFGLFAYFMDVFRRYQVRNTIAYILGSLGMWYSLLRSGVNADIAGVVAGFMIPAIAAPRRTKATNKYPTLLDHYIHFMEGWSNFFIMPLFAIANTAVPLGGGALGVARSPVAQGIMAGLLLGKPLGIAGASLVALKYGWCSWPTGMKPIHLGICGMLGGIAFTMSLFLIEQSLVGSQVAFAKLAVIFGSTAAAIIASVFLKRQPIKDFAAESSEDATSS